MKACGAVLLALVLFFIVAFPAVVEAHWDAWGPVYVRLMFDACHYVAPSQHIVQFGTQLYSSAIELSVFPQCTGLDMIRVYSILFGVVMLFDWKHAQQPTSLMLYVSGLCMFWAGNFYHNVLEATTLHRPSCLMMPFVLGVFVFATWPALLRGRAKPLADRGASA